MKRLVPLAFLCLSNVAYAQNTPPVQAQPTVAQLNAAMGAKLGDANVQIIWLQAQLEAANSQLRELRQQASGEGERTAKAVADALAGKTTVAAQPEPPKEDPRIVKMNADRATHGAPPVKP